MRITSWAQTEGGRRLAAAYLVVQAGLGVVWWVLLFSVDGVRAHFELLAEHRNGLNAFLVADGIVFVAGSMAAAVAVLARSRWATTVTAFTAGGVVYAGLYLLQWELLEHTAGAGLVPMAVAAVATTAIAVGTHDRPDPGSLDRA